MSDELEVRKAQLEKIIQTGTHGDPKTSGKNVQDGIAQVVRGRAARAGNLNKVGSSAIDAAKTITQKDIVNAGQSKIGKSLNFAGTGPAPGGIGSGRTFGVPNNVIGATEGSSLDPNGRTVGLANSNLATSLPSLMSDLSADVAGGVAANANRNAATALVNDVEFDERLNNFRALPKAPVDSSNGAEAKGRASYDDINALFQNKLIRNELYVSKDGTRGYDLTAYNITLFMIEKSVLFKKTMNEVAREGFDANAQDCIVIAQSAGTDEHYIESFEFTSWLGFQPEKGSGRGINDGTMVLKSPNGHDLVDQLMKAAFLAGWENHLQCTYFIQIDWKARDVDTGEPIKQVGGKFRCYPVFIQSVGGSSLQISAALDEGGSSYNFSFQGLNKESMNNVNLTMQEDTRVEGKTVGEMFGNAVVEYTKFQIEKSDSIVRPDFITVEWMDDAEPMALYPLIVKEQAEVSSKRNDASEVDKGQTTKSPGHPSGTTTIKHVKAATNSSISNTKTDAETEAALNKKKFDGTLSIKAGDTLEQILIKILSNTTEGQKLVTKGLDPQAPDAKQKKVEEADPVDVVRHWINVDIDAKILGYDTGRKKYAQHVYMKIFKKKNATMSRVQHRQVQQTPETSKQRLANMLMEGYLYKAYHHMYTGLNTEVKNVEWSFDNLATASSGIYSGVVNGFQNRDAGIRALKAEKGGAHQGMVEPAINTLRWDMQAAGFLDPVIAKKIDEFKQIDKDLQTEGAFEGGPPNLKARKIEQAAKLKKEIAEAEKAFQKVQNEVYFKAIQASGGKVGPEQELVGTVDSFDEDGAKIVTTVNAASLPAEKRQALLQGLGPNARLVKKGDRIFYRKVEEAQTSAIKDLKLRLKGLENQADDNAPGGSGALFLADIPGDVIQDRINSGAMFPVKFSDAKIHNSAETGTTVHYDKGRSLFSEVYQNAHVDMLEIDLGIRGDCYWLPDVFGDNGNESVSPNVIETYFLLVADQGEMWDPADGRMIIQNRNALNAIYVVHECTHNFSGGEFTTTLRGIRDTSIDLNQLFPGGGTGSIDEAAIANSHTNAGDGLGT